MSWAAYHPTRTNSEPILTLQVGHGAQHDDASSGSSSAHASAYLNKTSMLNVWPGR